MEQENNISNASSHIQDNAASHPLAQEWVDEDYDDDEPEIAPRTGTAIVSFAQGAQRPRTCWMCGGMLLVEGGGAPQEETRYGAPREETSYCESGEHHYVLCRMHRRHVLMCRRGEEQNNNISDCRCLHDHNDVDGPVDMWVW